MIRAKVELLRASLDPESREEARRRATSYVLLARDYLERERPQLIAIGGLSGSGKSSVAQALAPHLGVFPGAVHVRSDVERKRLFGVERGRAAARPAYAAEVSDIVYTMCRKRALMALEGGHSVIVDAVHAKKEERDAVAEIAARAGAAFTGIWLDATAETMRQRIAARTGDVSDATPDVLDEQLSYDLGPADIRRHRRRKAARRGGSVLPRRHALQARLGSRAPSSNSSFPNPHAGQSGQAPARLSAALV